MIAALACYDFPEIRPAAETWWEGIGKALHSLGEEAAPKRLYWPEDVEAHWRQPGIYLTQTCGYPLVTFLKGKLRAVATPCYAAEGCAGPFYSSALVVRAGEEAASLEEFRGRRVAINSPHSHSGYNVLRAMVAPLAGGAPFFAEVFRSGGHVKSCESLVAGKADLAAIDCVTWALARRHRPDLREGLRVLCYSPQAPALPDATSVGASEEEVFRLREALYEAAADPLLEQARSALLLQGFAALPEEAYEEMTAMERAASTLGYEELR